MITARRPHHNSDERLRNGWKEPVFDEHEGVRVSHGRGREHRLYRILTHRNFVPRSTHDFPSVEAATEKALMARHSSPCRRRKKWRARRRRGRARNRKVPHRAIDQRAQKGLRRGRRSRPGDISVINHHFADDAAMWKPVHSTRSTRPSVPATPRPSNRVFQDPPINPNRIVVHIHFPKRGSGTGVRGRAVVAGKRCPAACQAASRRPGYGGVRPSERCKTATRLEREVQDDPRRTPLRAEEVQLRLGVHREADCSWE